MELSSREKKILEIVKKYEPITGDEIANELSVSKSTLRTELALLVKLGLLESKTNVGYFYNNDITENYKYDVLKSTNVREVMGVAVTAKNTDSFAEVVSKLFIYDVGTIFIVTDENILEGVVSRKDMLKVLLANSNANNLPVAMAMTRVPNVVYVREDAALLEALRKIISREVDCLPIINEENKVIGRVSKTTIIRKLLDILEG